MGIVIKGTKRNLYRGNNSGAINYGSIVRVDESSRLYQGELLLKTSDDTYPFVNLKTGDLYHYKVINELYLELLAAPSDITYE